MGQLIQNSADFVVFCTNHPDRVTEEIFLKFIHLCSGDELEYLYAIFGGPYNTLRCSKLPYPVCLILNKTIKSLISSKRFEEIVLGYNE